MAIRPALTPGWLSRSPLTAAPRLRAPMALAATRSMTLSRLASIDSIAIGHWRQSPALMRPWYQAARINPWFGLSQHYAFRPRRQKESDVEAVASRRATVQRFAAAPEVPAEPGAWYEPDEVIAPWAAQELSGESEAQPQPAIGATADDFAPISLPTAFASASADSPRVAPRATERTVISRAQPVTARDDVTRGPSPVVRVPAAVRATDGTALTVRRRVQSETPQVAQPPTPVADGATASMPAPVPHAVDSTAPDTHEPTDAIPVISAPAWPFQFVSPAMAFSATSDVPVAQTPAAWAASAPLIVRRRPAEATAAISSENPPQRESAQPPATIVAPITTTLPVAQMMSKVPPTEALLAESARQIAQTHAAPDESPAPLTVAASTTASAPDAARTVRRAASAAPVTASEPAPTRAETIARAPLAPTAQLARDWPVLAAVQRMLSPLSETAMPAESAAERVVRRMPVERREAARAGIESLPGLGGGEPLPAEVRRPMEIIVGRGLGDVRIYTSPVAAELGVEAFTSGEHIVFAPGRLDLRSTRGLSLVGHELAHVGQTLAFREGDAPSATDAAEQAARQQEAQITQIIEQGWPQAPRMEVLDAARALGRLAGAQAAPGNEGGAPQQAAPASAGGGGAPAAQAGGAAGGSAPASGSSSGGGAGGGSNAPAGGASGAPGGAQAPNLDKLAQDVYELLKVRLRADSIRRAVH